MVNVSKPENIQCIEFKFICCTRKKSEMSKWEFQPKTKYSKKPKQLTSRIKYLPVDGVFYCVI